MSVTREKLYEEIWTEPMTTVAERYGVSSNYLAQICTRLNVPRPSRGYWARLEAGKACDKPPLPEARPGDDIEWARGGRARIQPFPPPKAPDGESLPLYPPEKRPTRHELTSGARELFELGKVTDNGYLRPAQGAIVDAFVTQGTLRRALDFLTTLFTAFEARGHRVTFAPARQYLVRPSVDTSSPKAKARADHYGRDTWSPGRVTLAYVGTVAIGLSLFELSERVMVHSVDGKYVRVPERRRGAMANVYAFERDMPCGKLCLRSYSPYPRTDWTRVWVEADGVKLTALIDEIVREAQAAAPKIETLVEEAVRQAEIERKEAEIAHEKWKREEIERQRQQTIKESRDELLSIIAAWGEVRRIEGFFDDAERRIAELAPAEAEALRERLQRARQLVGEADALRGLREWAAPEERARPWSIFEEVRVQDIGDMPASGHR